MAKFGIALGSGPRGHGFESRHSDHTKSLETVIYQRIQAFSHFWKFSTKRKCQQKVSTNSKKFRCVLLFLCSLDNIIINRWIVNRWIVNRWIFVIRLNVYPLYVWTYTRITFERIPPVKFFYYPLQPSSLGVCKGQFSEMLFIQKCPVRGLKSFRHEIILPYFFRGIVGQKIAKNATF